MTDCLKTIALSECIKDKCTETNKLQRTKHHWVFEIFGAICSYLSKVSKFYTSNEFSLEFNFAKDEQKQCFILMFYSSDKLKQKTKTKK